MTAVKTEAIAYGDVISNGALEIAIFGVEHLAPADMAEYYVLSGVIERGPRKLAAITLMSDAGEVWEKKGSVL